MLVTIPLVIAILPAETLPPTRILVPLESNSWRPHNFLRRTIDEANAAPSIFVAGVRDLCSLSICKILGHRPPGRFPQRGDMLSFNELRRSARFWSVYPTPLSTPRQCGAIAANAETNGPTTTPEFGAVILSPTDRVGMSGSLFFLDFTSPRPDFGASSTPANSPQSKGAQALYTRRF